MFACYKLKADCAGIKLVHIERNKKSGSHGKIGLTGEAKSFGLMSCPALWGFLGGERLKVAITDFMLIKEVCQAGLIWFLSSRP